MPESVLTILKFCFLALLFLFLYRIVRVVLLEMRAPVPVPSGGGGGVAAAPARPARGGPSQLRILEPGECRGETFVISDDVTVGRGGGCGIVLGDDTFVSQVHARLFRRDGDVFVEDLGSRNGTLLNGDPVTNATRVRRGDRVQFGRTITEALR